MAIRTSSNHPTRIRPWVGYGLYTLVLLIGFLYFLFPYQNVQQWVERKIEQRMGVQIYADQRNAGPFWFEWKGLRFFKEHSPLLDRFHFPVWRINFIPRSVLYQPFRFTSTLSLWKGRGEGWLMVSPDSSGYEVGVVHSLADLDVTSFQLPYVKEGMLSIKVDYHWHQHQPLTGEGQGKFTFTSLQIKDLPLYSDGGISLKISSASGLLMVKERDWTLNEFRMQGEGFSFSGQGRVQLASNVFESRIESEGVLYFSPEFTKMFPQVQYLNTESGQPITLRLWGTLRTPSMELNGNGIVIPLEPSLLFTAMS